MNEDKLESRLGSFQRLLEPPVLLRSERADPVVVVVALPGSEPVRVEHDEQRVAMLP